MANDSCFSLHLVLVIVAVALKAHTCLPHAGLATPHACPPTRTQALRRNFPSPPQVQGLEFFSGLYHA